MTLMDDRPRTVVECDTAPLHADVLFAEARARARRRRLWTIVAVAVGVAVAVAAGLEFVPPPSAHPVRVAAKPAYSTDAVGFPTTLVAYDGYPGTEVGGIEVIDSHTGETIKTLVRNSADPLTTPLQGVQIGFDLSNDGRTVYFVSTSSYSARHSEIESVSTAGGEVKRVAAGTHPDVSPDGAMLAFEPPADDRIGATGFGPRIAIRNLRTGATTTITVPGVQAGQEVSMAWLADSTRLVVYASNLVSTEPGVVLPTVKHPNVDPQFGTSTHIYNMVTKSFSTAPAAVTVALTATAKLTPAVEGAGVSANTIRVSAVVDPYSSHRYTELGMLNISTGAATWQFRVPSNMRIDLIYAQLPGQDSGKHFILAANSEGMNRWSPEHGSATAPVGIGKQGRVLGGKGLWVFS